MNLDTLSIYLIAVMLILITTSLSAILIAITAKLIEMLIS